MEMKMKKGIVIGAVLASCLQALGAYQPTWESLNSRTCPEWWQDAKFGIFIFWGPYSVPAYAPTGAKHVYDRYAEHYANRIRRKNSDFMAFHEKHFPGVTYEEFAARFHAKDFDADRWLTLFKRAGAKYTVLAAKHHGGFALWPSAATPYFNSVKMGPQRDICGAFADASRKAGLRFGYYFSLLEWTHPLYKKETIGTFVKNVNRIQLEELVTRYLPDIVYGDGEWDYSSDVLETRPFLAWLYNESPVRAHVVTNDRWGKETRGRSGDYYTTEYDLVHQDNMADSRFAHPWEECRGLAHSFGYNRYETSEDYMTPAQCVEMLVEKVARGGNLLLDVGPDEHGLIPVAMEDRLLAMGRWLNVNGEAIYGTRAWEHRPDNMRQNGLYYTVKGNVLYVIVTRWPQKAFYVPKRQAVETVSLLGSPLPVVWRKDGDGILIEPPAVNPGNMPCEHAWTFKIK
jgi:alpha-L-fucosidase